VRIIVDIGHPAHVHFFKNFIWEMRTKGHEILVTASKKDVTLDLLESHGIDYTFTCKRYSGFGFAYELLKRDVQMFNIARRFRPDVITGVHNTVAAHISKVTKAKSIIFTDTEHGRLANLITFPFSDVICTPFCFKKDLGKKHVRYHGYHELAYLHPNYFKPDPLVLDDMGLSADERFAMLRFVSWKAVHDTMQRGLDLGAKRRIVQELKKHVRLFITSEGALPDEFEEYGIRLPPERIHSLMYYAQVLIGDSQTMTTEAAILGVPAIRCNSWVGPNDMSNFVELEQEYDLIYSFRKPDEAIQKALELLQQSDLKDSWARKRDRLLVDKVNVTQLMVDFVENYPESLRRYKGNSQS